MIQDEVFKVIIIEGGTAVLYSAFYRGLKGMKTKIIEYRPVLGGKLHIYSEKLIWEVGGHKSLPSAELIKQLIEHMKKCPLYSF